MSSIRSMYLISAVQLGRKKITQNPITLQKHLAYLGPKMIKKIKWDRVGKRKEFFTLLTLIYSQRFKSLRAKTKKVWHVEKSPDIYYLSDLLINLLRIGEYTLPPEIVFSKTARKKNTHTSQNKKKKVNISREMGFTTCSLLTSNSFRCISYLRIRHFDDHLFWIRAEK